MAPNGSNATAGSTSSTTLPQTPSHIHVSSALTHKLTPNNFVLWRTQLMPILRGYRLASHIDSAVAPPAKTLPTGAENPAYADWEQLDQQVLSWIVSSCSATVLPQIVGATTACAAYDKLVRAYSAGSRSQIRELKHRLHNLRRENDSISSYLLTAKSIYDELVALQHPISDEDLVEAVLEGLGAAYRPFVRALEARLEPILFDDLIGLLHSEERQLARDTVPQSFSPSVKFSSRNSGRGRGRGRSYPNQNYRSSHNSNTVSAPVDSSTIVCHNCRGNGHISRQCPSPRYSRSTRNANRPQSNLAASSTPSQADWLVDSGATHHLTADLGNLHVHSDYDGPEEITVCNGLEDQTGDSSRAT